MSDHIQTFLGLAGMVRILVVRAEQLTTEVVVRHGLGGVSARLGVEGTLASLLLSAHIKGDERLFVQVQASEPNFSLMADVNARGDVRARLSPDRILPHEQIVGMLLAIKYDGSREVYRGVAEVRSPGFEGALASYLDQSQQTWGQVRLLSRFGRGVAPEIAAAILVERLPNLLTVEEFEEWMAPLRERSVQQLLDELAEGSFLGNPTEMLEDRPLRFHCPCGVERVEHTLLMLGAEDLRALHKEQGQAEVTCNFCNERYVVPGPRLLSMLKDLESPPA